MSPAKSALTCIPARSQKKACLDNIGIVLKPAGMDHSNVVPAQVFLTDIIQFKRMNAAYAQRQASKY
jgi:enamine deaminase RidA (YjgF/YER057c/UK114 family)